MITILFHDASLAICVKPAGISSQEDGTQNDMVTQLGRQLNCSIYPVHRLDLPVGGVIVYAKTATAAAALSRSMQDGSFQKEYITVVTGCVEPKEGRMDDLLLKDSRSNKSFVVTRMRKGVREASLSYRTVSEAILDGAPVSLVQVMLETGRSHQIRVQFASRKHPLLGDRLYGSRVKLPIALWSAALRFPHPKTGKEMVYRLPMPDTLPWSLF